MKLVDVNLNEKTALLLLTADEVEDMIQGINCQMEQGECSIEGGREASLWLRNNILKCFED